MSTKTKPTYLNNNRCGGIWIDSQNANALQSPLHYHLILLFRFSWTTAKHTSLNDRSRISHTLNQRSLFVFQIPLTCLFIWNPSSTEKWLIPIFMKWQTQSKDSCDLTAFKQDIYHQLNAKLKLLHKLSTTLIFIFLDNYNIPVSIEVTCWENNHIK